MTLLPRRLRSVVPTMMLLALAGLVAWTSGCAGATPKDPRAPVPMRFEGTVPVPDLDRLERLIHAQVNDVRRSRGLGELAWDDELAEIARTYSVRLRRADRLTHSIRRNTLERRYTRAGYDCMVPVRGSNRYLTGGENLALIPQVPQILVSNRGPGRPARILSEAEVARETVQGWMNSPPHRENLLIPHWQGQGIGLVIDKDHRLWITQNFC